MGEGEAQGGEAGAILMVEGAVSGFKQPLEVVGKGSEEVTLMATMSV
jgi:hypothetical protein